MQTEPREWDGAIMNQSYVTDRFDLVLCSKICHSFLYSIKAETQGYNIIYHTLHEGQWKSNSALKVDKLVTPLLTKWALNHFGTPAGKLFFVYTHSALFTPS
jgi:hypothetical protein